MANWFYFIIVLVLLGIGLADENAVLCCASGLFAIAGEIQAKWGE